MASLIASPEAGKAGKPQTWHRRGNSSGGPSEWIRGAGLETGVPCECCTAGGGVAETPQGTRADV